MLLKNDLKTVQHLNSLVDCNEYLLDHDHDFYIEDYFHKMLSLERKRTARSQNPFMLLLIKFNNLLPAIENKRILKKVSTVLASTPRDTDIKGWYSYCDTIGVIFTDITVDGQEIIKRKIHTDLNYELGPELIGKIEISFHLFPEEDNQNQKPDKSEFDLNLYSDLSRHNPSSPTLTASKLSLFLKRTMDIVGSVFGIALFSPFFLLIPILIKLTSKGPVFFRQERMGQLGGKFSFLKFRSMYINSGEQAHKKYIEEYIRNEKCADEGKNGDKGVYKLKNDTRITPLGNFLRKTSLDELPQFFNVLMGQMSIVGPRPPIPYELAHYDIWHRRRVLEIKPGITGMWQIRGRSSTTFDEMVRMDIQYIKEWTLLLDLKIIAITPWVLLTGKGGY